MLAITPQTRKTLRIVVAWDKYRERQQKADKARQRVPRKLDRRRFDELAGDVSRIMKLGEPTPFAFEGSCRHGVRSSLCLDGWGWADADDAAVDVITRAMNIIGLVRPTWWQGQPEYADTDTSRGFCAAPKCQRPIPIERGMTAGTAARYCSDFCKSAAHSARLYRDGPKTDLATYLAAQAAKSAETERQRSRNCANAECGKFFVTKDPKRKYCSRSCWDAREKIYQERPCERPECDNVFTPKNSGKTVSRYCSRECADACRRKVRPALTCQNPECATIFYPNFPSDKRKYCGDQCRPDAVRRLAALRMSCEETK